MLEDGRTWSTTSQSSLNPNRKGVGLRVWIRVEARARMEPEPFSGQPPINRTLTLVLTQYSSEQVPESKALARRHHGCTLAHSLQPVVGNCCGSQPTFPECQCSRTVKYSSAVFLATTTAESRGSALPWQRLAGMYGRCSDIGRHIELCV